MIEAFDYRILKHQAVKARFMTAAQFAQLSSNIRIDGCVTSALLCYRDPETGETEIVSGSERCKAAIAAEVFKGPVIIITTPLTMQRLRALQLSHNAVTGQDDAATLAEMYSGLDLGAKTYSGLDDSVLGAAAKVQLSGLSVTVRYRELNLFFLGEDAAAVEHGIARIEKAARNKAAYVAAYQDFDDLFDLMVRAKTKFETFNSGITMRLLIDLATAKLDELEVDKVAEQTDGG